MIAKIVSSDDLAAWVESLIGAQTVYGPQSRGERFSFDRLRKAADLRLDYDVTLLPPKKYFQPQQETLMTFNRKGDFESVIERDPFVLFGVHPYDFVAIAQLDKIFSTGHPDVHYLARREAATIVVSDVQTPSPDVFAGAMGNATVEHRKGYDVLVTRLDDGRYVVDPRTPKGETLLAGLKDAPSVDPEGIRLREEAWARNRDRLRKHELKMDPGDIPALLAKSRDHPVWAEKADLCYSCGSCNLVCPTCYCFTVEDELNWDMETGRRTRVWDGCMLTHFATVAGNHNFRPKKAARYRHRYYRKGKYVHDMIGEIACVGCGRCIAACTANIANPVEIFNRLLEEK